jgi:hypothetical protein
MANENGDFVMEVKMENLRTVLTGNSKISD